MTTPATLLDATLAQYESGSRLNYSSNIKDIHKIILKDAIFWTNFKLYEKKLISKEEYDRIRSMVHSEDEENLVVAEAIIRNLDFKF
jgi:hypothetical protein